jgi:hypothetical protein
MKMTTRWFVGGPMDGQRITTMHGRTEYRVPVLPELEDSLQASIEVLERGMAAVPVRIALYRLNTVTGEFVFEEYERG